MNDSIGTERSSGSAGGGNAMSTGTRLHIGQAKRKSCGCQGAARRPLLTAGRPARRRLTHPRPGLLDGRPAGRRAEPVLVVDAHELMGTALVTTLRASGVDAYACTPATLPGPLPALRRSNVVLVHIDPGSCPIGQVTLVKALSDRGLYVLLLDGGADPQATAAAVAAGAVGRISKSAPFAALLQALEAAAHGRPVMSDADRQHWLDLDRRRQLRAHQEQRVTSELTPRERTVLQRLAGGHKAAVIAAENGVSLETVRSQIRSIRVKLGVSSQLEAVALLRGAGG